MDDDEDEDRYLMVLDTIIFIGWRMIAGFAFTAAFVWLVTR